MVEEGQIDTREVHKDAYSRSEIDKKKKQRKIKMIFLSQDSEGGKPNQSSGQLCRTAVGGRILRRKRVLSHLKAAFPCPLNMVWMDPLLWKSTSHGFEIGSLAGITDLALASQECPHSWHESP